MTKETRLDDLAAEEIQGAPPVSTEAEMRERRLGETITLNRYLYLQTQQLEHMLLAAVDVTDLLEVLLVSMPRHFSLQVSELWLFDPDGSLAALGILDTQRYGPHLQLHGDVFAMQELYEVEPDVELIDATDARMFEVLKSDQGIDHALLLPLICDGKMVGSFHLGLNDDVLWRSEASQDVMAHLAVFVAVCFANAVQRQKISRLTLLDPLTHASNSRGFEKDISREIARAQRADQPLTVLMLEVDEYGDLGQHYGDVTAQLVLKKVAERIASSLRATDHMARLEGSCMAVLLPGSSELVSLDIAERMREDIASIAIDDGRGAVLDVSVSIGLVGWEPKQFPAVDMLQLARQMEASAEKALLASRAKSGNAVSVSRLTTLLV